MEKELKTILENMQKHLNTLTTDVSIMKKDFKDHEDLDDNRNKDLHNTVKELPEKMGLIMDKKLEGYTKEIDFVVFQANITNALDNACSEIKRATTLMKDESSSMAKWLRISMGLVGFMGIVMAVILYLK